MRKIKALILYLTALLLALRPVAALGAEYEAGTILTVEVRLTSETFNTAGFSLAYDPTAVKLAKEGIQVHDSCTVLRKLEQEGSVACVMYVAPGGNSPAVDAADGTIIATITFEVLRTADPGIALARLEGDVDFSDTPFFTLSNGTMTPETSAELLVNGTLAQEAAAEEFDTPFVAGDTPEETEPSESEAAEPEETTATTEASGTTEPTSAQTRNFSNEEHQPQLWGALLLLGGFALAAAIAAAVKRRPGK